MSRLKIEFDSICQLAGRTDRGLLILKDTMGERQIAVPCDGDTLHAFAARMGSNRHPNDLLPEALWAVVGRQVDLSLEIVVTSVTEDGQYEAMLLHSHTMSSHPIRMTEAVLLSFASNGEIPIYIDSIIFERHSSLRSADGLTVAVPLDVMSEEMLQEAMDNAVKEENYKLASLLRDELNKRKKS